VYHRTLKQCCGVERAQGRKAISILGHLLLALRAFLRLEAYWLRTGVSGDEAQAAILREAIRRYRAHPHCVLQPTA
jgi:putative transposase